MPANIPVLANFQSGTLASSLASTATAITVSPAPSFPTVGTDEYVPMTLINTASPKDSEVVYVTAYTAANTTLGVLRGQEGAASTTWAASVPWEHAPTKRNYYPAVTVSGNTSGTMTNMSSGLMALAGGSNITLQQSSNTISIHGPTTAATMTLLVPHANDPGVAGAVGAGTLNLQHAVIPTYMAMDRINIYPYVSNASNSTCSATLSFRAGIYTRNASTLSLVASGSITYAMTNAGTGSSATFHGIRVASIPFTATTLPPDEYVIGLWSSTATASQNGSFSQVVASKINSTFQGSLGVATNTSYQSVSGMGVLSVTTNAMPASIPFTSIRANSSAFQRSPIFYAVSGAF